MEGVAHVIDAKAMSKDDLYGVMDPNTREWTDGLFTSIIRRYGYAPSRYQLIEESGKGTLSLFFKNYSISFLDLSLLDLHMHVYCSQTVATDVRQLYLNEQPGFFPADQDISYHRHERIKCVDQKYS